LKYRLIDAFGPLTYCDPDEYPISHGDEAQKALERLPEIKADSQGFAAILASLGLAGTAEFTPDEQLAIYREWKRLNAVVLTSVAKDEAAFDLVTETDPGLGQGKRTRGTIDVRGTIRIESTEPTFLVGCPICLARGTLIDTPLGAVPVERLREGAPVWTPDATGRRIAGVVAATGRAGVPPWHVVIHLVLDDGRELHVSPGHPLADGRLVGSVRPGDLVEGRVVLRADPVPYGALFTYDLLPSGDTGLYWADGLLLASTLGRQGAEEP
jgi:hypothetical protein